MGERQSLPDSVAQCCLNGGKVDPASERARTTVGFCVSPEELESLYALASAESRSKRAFLSVGGLVLVTFTSSIFV